MNVSNIEYILCIIMTLEKEIPRSLVTRMLKKIYPLEKKEKGKKTVKNLRKYDNFSENQIDYVIKYIQERREKKQKKKDIWTRMQLMKYFQQRGIEKYVDIKDIPKSVVKKYEKKPEFREFKKRKGYELLFKKMKGRHVKSEKELNKFIKLLKAEKRQKYQRNFD
jgi:hypothetical protein